MMAAAETSSITGLLLVSVLILPVVGILAQLALGGRFLNWICLAVFPASFGVSAATCAVVWSHGEPLIYIVGGWQPPLGIALRADGISAAMMLVTAIIICAVAIFARVEFTQPSGAPEARAPFVFWALILALWSALNALFLGCDLFNLYVALELLTFAAVPLVCLKGGEATVKAALRYLLFALLGSMLYLMGTALLYGAYGTLDITLLAQRVHPERVTWIAAALMTVGLLTKTALFPLHLWLPPAHAGAPAAGSAVLSALVVKGSFFLIVRLWFDAMPGLGHTAGPQLLASLGAAAILFGSVMALRQQRLKLLVAYSTVAQIGYLFLMFPLVMAAEQSWTSLAWTGGWLQLFSHAFAKAAMFLAAGLIADALGHDRINDLGGAGRLRPLTFCTFGLAGLSLIGVPPSGGFVAKWLLLSASVAEGQWIWAAVIVVGGLLAGGYIFKVLGRAFTAGSDAPVIVTPVSLSREVVAFSLAVGAVLLGFFPLEPAEILQIGRPEILGSTVP